MRTKTRCMKKRSSRRGASLLLLFALASIMLCLLFANRLVHAAKEGASPEGQYISVQIQRGDTLWSLAQEYLPEGEDSVADYVGEIMRLNHMAGEEIQAGHYLTLYVEGSDASGISPVS